MAKKTVPRKKKNTKSQTTKYIFIVGGVMSGVGKGVASSSIALLLQSRGFKVTSVKIDPYINVDAGTMNPLRHGEVFVLDDGAETDQDLGNYERFLNKNLTSSNIMTTGGVYLSVIQRERNLEYDGRDVEVIPDIPREVIHRIKTARDEADADIVVIEIGGTIGEYQNLIFLEAARMLKHEAPDDVMIAMVSYLPTPQSVGEMKTKPTQYASRTLNSVGLMADMIIARSAVPLDDTRKEKIALFCNVPTSHVISAPDVSSIYDVPLNFQKANVDEHIITILGLPKKRTSNLDDWKKFVKKTKNGSTEINIAVVGKYFNSGNFVLSDVYLSVLEALKFSGYHEGCKVKIDYIDSQSFEKDPHKLKELSRYQGVLIPGGFGKRGIDGKLKVIEFVRKNKIPYFGLCYGMQLLVVEYARNVMGLKGAHTTEIIKKTPHPVIDIMEEQIQKLRERDMGGTMRLGAYPCKVKKGTQAYDAFKKEKISERHRHRYEVNPQYIKQFEDAGLVFSGTSPDGHLMEIAELPKSKHPFMLGIQSHPEFLARPLSPHPLFSAFVRAAKNEKKKK